MRRIALATVRPFAGRQARSRTIPPRQPLVRYPPPRARQFTSTPARSRVLIRSHDASMFSGRADTWLRNQVAAMDMWIREGSKTC
jgi:hypothetical protein